MAEACWLEAKRSCLSTLVSATRLTEFPSALVISPLKRLAIAVRRLFVPAFRAGAPDSPISFIYLLTYRCPCYEQKHCTGSMCDLTEAGRKRRVAKDARIAVSRLVRTPWIATGPGDGVIRISGCASSG